MMNFPELYVKINQVTPEITKRIVNNYKHQLKWKKNENIADIGFGDGKTCEEAFFPNFPVDYNKLLATDISSEMVEYAKKHVKIPKIEFIQHDISTEKLDTEFIARFDHIFSAFVVHRIKNTKQSLKNIYDMLKFGGQTLLIFLEREPMGDVHETLSKNPKWAKYYENYHITAHYYKKSPKGEFEKELQLAGFKNYIINVEQYDYTFNDDQTWKGLYLSVNPQFSIIPEDKVEEYKKDFFERAKSSPSIVFSEMNEKKIATLRMKMLIILGNKTKN